MGVRVTSWAMGFWLSTVLSVTAVGVPGETGQAAFIDPVLLHQYRSQPMQLAILVLTPHLEAAVVDSLAEMGLQHHAYPLLDMVAVVLPKEKLSQVANLEGVEVVFRNEHMEAMLSRSAPYVGAPLVWNTYAVRGRGVTILVVDTGVDGTHPDVKYGSNLIENVIPTRTSTGLIGGYSEGVVASDADGHGTHVAGIVGGTAYASGPGDSLAGKYKGIAPEASLVGFEAGIPNAATGEASFDSVTVLEAYNYALDKRRTFNIRIVTNSWGSNGEFNANSPINLATLNLYRAGLVVVFAAGNEGAQGPGTLNQYSVAPWVLSVGAGDYLNRRAPFSSIGTNPTLSNKAYDHPDLLAPGSQITAARARTDAGVLGSLLSATSNGDLYVAKSGTSMAAPHVSGAAALLLSKNPKLSPDEVYDLLVGSTTPLPSGPVWEVGRGYLNVLRAYDEAQELPGSLEAFLGGKVKYAGKLVGDVDFSEDPLTVGLHNGTDSGFLKADTSLPEFGKSLVTTGQGLTFVAGTAVLSLLSFRFRRGETE